MVVIGAGLGEEKYKTILGSSMLTIFQWDG